MVFFLPVDSFNNYFIWQLSVHFQNDFLEIKLKYLGINPWMEKIRYIDEIKNNERIMMYSWRTGNKKF